VRQHLKVSGEKSKEYLFKNNISEITYKNMGNELAALLFEASEIKKHKPIYNTALRKRYYPYFIYPKENSQGFIEFHIKKSDEFEENVIKTGSKRSGTSLIRKIYDKAFGVQIEKGLKASEKELMLEQKLALFKSTLGVDKFNKTLLKHYQSMNFPHDEFSLKLNGRVTKENCIINYKKGEKLKIQYIKNEETREELLLPVYEDTRQILVQYIQKKELKVHT
jgi:DNA polymerase-3 subunit epsilon